ncbi:MAG: Gfo/Idh/MocA family oxidoreductase [Clostridia bacterium]|nr:Gfo/Idh/MocA family oxidoreductase [Clostridia bacterium]MCQ2480461.1 Gfo/Idh/MocA family oxidoreductase [Clostridia bacterium]
MVGKKFGAAVIGYGGMGSWHTRKMREQMTDDVEFIGIYDINPERAKVAEENGIHAFSSREELLNDERIDFVVVATPNNFHREIAVDAMAHGKNVISEKPVTTCVSELKKMIEASEKYGKIFTVHQNRRWDPDYLTVKKIYDGNMLGRIFRIESRVHGSRGVPGDWRNHKEFGGGMVFDWGIHIIDQALMLMGDAKIESVYAITDLITTDDCDDGFKLELKFSNGIEYHLEVGTSNFIELPRWYVLGENGSAIVRDWDLNGEIVMVSDWENKDAVPVQAGVGLTKTMAPRTDDSIEKFPLPYVENLGFNDRSEFYKNFIATLRGEATQTVTHAQQLRLIKLIEAIFESANENKVVYFEK